MCKVSADLQSASRPVGDWGEAVQLLDCVHPAGPGRFREGLAAAIRGREPPALQALEAGVRHRQRLMPEQPCRPLPGAPGGQQRARKACTPQGPAERRLGDGPPVKRPGLLKRLVRERISAASTRMAKRPKLLKWLAEEGISAAGIQREWLAARSLEIAGMACRGRSFGGSCPARVGDRAPNRPGPPRWPAGTGDRRDHRSALSSSSWSPAASDR